jgi:hypothetical protein
VVNPANTPLTALSGRGRTCPELDAARVDAGLGRAGDDVVPVRRAGRLERELDAERTVIERRVGDDVERAPLCGLD